MTCKCCSVPCNRYIGKSKDDLPCKVKCTLLKYRMSARILKMSKSMFNNRKCKFYRSVPCLLTIFSVLHSHKIECGAASHFLIVLKAIKHVRCQCQTMAPSYQR